jgi:chromosome segregation ATPase
MQDMIIELSLYLVVAILLGFSFGWFGAKSMIKERYEDLLEEFKQKYRSEFYKIEKNQEELSHYKKINKELINTSNQLQLKYEHEKHAIGEYLQELKQLRSFVLSKDKMIEKLTFELSHYENKLLALEEEHDAEMEAFVYERNETLHKYKNLQDKLRHCHGETKIEGDGESWIKKVFKNSKEKVY